MSSTHYPRAADFRARLLSRVPLSGMFLQLGSPISAEIAAYAGFDGLVLDGEHGVGSEDATMAQLIAIAGSPSAVPLVRVTANEVPRFKRALDAGAVGVVVPLVDSVASAEAAVAATRYPPVGIRGVARMTRASVYGVIDQSWFASVAERIALIVQIETVLGVSAAAAIAAIDGVDCLFVGPTDLGVALAGRPIAFEDERLVTARRAVAAAAAKAGKAAGILCATAEQVSAVRAEGFTFVCLGSDLGALAAGVRLFATALRS